MLVDGLRHGPDREKDRVERQTVDVTDRQLETHLNARVLLSISASVHFPVLKRFLLDNELTWDSTQSPVRAIGCLLIKGSPGITGS